MGDLMELVKEISLNAVDASKPAAVVYGTVISTAPLRIDVELKQPLQAAHLVLTRNVTDYIFEMTVGHETTATEMELDTRHSHEYSGTTGIAEMEVGEGKIETHDHQYSGSTSQAGALTKQKHSHGYSGRKSFTVHNGLKAGERVILLRMQGGQQYIVLDRVV